MKQRIVEGLFHLYTLCGNCGQKVDWPYFLKGPIICHLCGHTGRWVKVPLRIKWTQQKVHWWSSWKTIEERYYNPKGQLVSDNHGNLIKERVLV